MSVDVQERRKFTAALLGDEAAPPPSDPSPQVVRGVALHVTAHMLTVATPKGEERFLFERTTAFWRGRDVGPQEIRVGDDVLVRCGGGGRWVVDRLWAQLGRITGTIVSADGDTVVVDPGHGRPPATAVIPYRSSGRMSVRHPVLEPGYLFDAVGVREGGTVQTTVPATTQPPHPVSRAPRRPPVRRVPRALSGIVSWYDPAYGRAAHTDPRAHAPGAAYPALDPGSDCGPDCDRSDPCLPLPLLSLGATVGVRNDDTGVAGVFPVLNCASAASRFCDRCRDGTGDTSGRLAELTLPAFVALGGRPEAGCFAATMEAG
ncbi:hypothetical protein [Nocardiopsis baichengensis]|uniref:hypothetical protein n=1 Tax=Nocardiopsis baichengensis TaxID=280240 RepID=UPI00034D918D|nr:hypothetical protein [Nocardiopsis baichengensis]